MKIKSIAHHRNGVTGEPFYAILFTCSEIKNGLAIVFDEPGHVAILDVDMLYSGDILFGNNSWRGDYFEPDLRNAIKKFEK